MISIGAIWLLLVNNKTAQCYIDPWLVSQGADRLPNTNRLAHTHAHITFSMSFSWRCFTWIWCGTVCSRIIADVFTETTNNTHLWVARNASGFNYMRPHLTGMQQYGMQQSCSNFWISWYQDASLDLGFLSRNFVWIILQFEWKYLINHFTSTHTDLYCRELVGWGLQQLPSMATAAGQSTVTELLEYKS